jgi:hypothetical protein
MRLNSTSWSERKAVARNNVVFQLRPACPLIKPYLSKEIDGASLVAKGGLVGIQPVKVKHLFALILIKGKLGGVHLDLGHVVYRLRLATHVFPLAGCLERLGPGGF